MRLRRYVPGPILREGKNEVILLEVEYAPEDATSAGRACGCPQKLLAC